MSADGGMLLQDYFGGSQRAMLIQVRPQRATLIQHSARPDSNVACKRLLAEFWGIADHSAPGCQRELMTHVGPKRRKMVHCALASCARSRALKHLTTGRGAFLPPGVTLSVVAGLREGLT